MSNLYENKKTLLNKTKDGTAQYFYETFVSCMRLTCPNKKLANDVNLSEKNSVHYYLLPICKVFLFKLDIGSLNKLFMVATHLHCFILNMIEDIQ